MLLNLLRNDGPRVPLAAQRRRSSAHVELANLHPAALCSGGGATVLWEGGNIPFTGRPPVPRRGAATRAEAALVNHAGHRAHRVGTPRVFHNGATVFVESARAKLSVEAVVQSYSDGEVVLRIDDEDALARLETG